MSSPPPDNVRPIHALAIVARPDTATDAMFEKLRATRMWSMTATALQRRINRLRVAKKAKSDEMNLKVKSTEAELVDLLTGENMVALIETSRRVFEALDAGEVVASEDLRALAGHPGKARALCLAALEAVRLKKREVGRIDVKIKQVVATLEKFLTRGIEDPKPSAQTTIPGVDGLDPEPEDWMGTEEKKTVITTVAYEVKEAARDEARASRDNDDAAARVAAQRRKDREDLLAELKAAGLVAEPETSDIDDASLELDFELAAEVEDETDDSEEVKPEESNAPGPERAGPGAGDGFVLVKPPEPVDPREHPDLQAPIAAAKKKAAKKRAAKKTRGGKK